MSSSSWRPDALEPVVEKSDERLGDVALEEPPVGGAQFGPVYATRFSGLNRTIRDYALSP